MKLFISLILTLCFSFINRLGDSCSHVAAVLYKAEAAVRLGYTSSVCTDLPMRWNKVFVDKVEANCQYRLLLYGGEICPVSKGVRVFFRRFDS